MILGRNKTTQDYIVEFLAKQPRKISTIHRYLSKYRDISRQAIYEQLRKLIEDGVILKHKTEYVISNEWIEKVRDFFSGVSLPQLEEGESLTYAFNSLAQMDQFWKHMFPVYSRYQHGPVYMYNNHCFWVYVEGRQESEINHYKSYQKRKKRAYFLIGGETELDFLFKRTFNNNFLKINCIQTRGFKKTDHITVIGDIVINSKTPPQFSENIDRIYRNKKLSKEEKINKINEEVAQIKKVYFKIEHNTKKAEKYRKIIGKDFV